MSFPIDHLLDQQACYDFLVRHLHPQGLRCHNGHPLPAQAAPHDRHRVPILDYRCKSCGNVFNVFTGTAWQKTHYTCSQIVQILRGFAQGIPTLHLATELGIHRPTLLYRRHRMQAALLEARPHPPMFAGVVEADEMYQNAGEKRDAASRSRRSASPTRQ